MKKINDLPAWIGIIVALLVPSLAAGASAIATRATLSTELEHAQTDIRDQKAASKALEQRLGLIEKQNTATLTVLNLMRPGVIPLPLLPPGAPTGTP